MTSRTNERDFWVFAAVVVVSDGAGGVVPAVSIEGTRPDGSWAVLGAGGFWSVMPGSHLVVESVAGLAPGAKREGTQGQPHASLTEATFRR